MLLSGDVSLALRCFFFFGERREEGGDEGDARAGELPPSYGTSAPALSASSERFLDGAQPMLSPRGYYNGAPT